MTQVMFSGDSPYMHEAISDNLDIQLQSQAEYKAIKQKMHEFVAASRGVAEISAELSRLMATAGATTSLSAPSDVLSSSADSSSGSRSRSRSSSNSNSGITATTTSHEALRSLSGIVAELGYSNEAMSETLQHSFLAPLDLFFESKEMAEILLQHDKYKHSKAQHSVVLYRYLQSDLIAQKNNKSGAASSTEDLRAFDVVTHFKKYEIDRFDLVSRINFLEQRKSLEVLEACVAAFGGLRVFVTSVAGVLSDTKLAHMNDLSGRVHDYKAAFLSDQLAMGRVRRDLEGVVDSMIERVQYQLPQSNAQGGTDQHHSIMDVSFRDVPSMASSSPGHGLLAGPSTSASPSSSPSAAALLPPAASEPLKLASLSSTAGLTRSFLFFGSSLMEGAAKTKEAVNRLGGEGSGGGGGTDGSTPRVPLSEVELKMKALELPSEFDSIYSSLSKFQFFSQNVRKQGFVFYLKGKIIKGVVEKGWRREWLVLDESKLYLVREGFEMELLVNLEVCSVRDKSRDYSFCLEIANANKSTISLIFEGNTAFVDWHAKLKASIEDRLGASTSTPMRPSQSSGCISAATDACSRAAMQLLIDEVVQSQTQCADCNADTSSNPQATSWVSLSTAAKVCIECSGIHRSLGSHISKVRSLLLDDLLEAEYRFILHGKEANAVVWESTDETHLWAGFVRPPTTTAERDALIRAKYMSKRFMRRMDPDASLDAALLEAVRRDDMPTAMLCLQQGACWNSKCDVLQLACENGSIDCVVLLVLNAAEGDNFEIKKAIETADAAGHRDITTYLSQKFSIF